jgi:hypothetical protein
MTAVVSQLRLTAKGPFESVVHVGAAGPEILDAYAQMEIQRLVLVCGDAEVAAQLRTRTLREEGVEIVEGAVGPRPGPSEWLRYNVSELNGLLNPAGLHDIFPRLRLVSRTSVDVVGLQALLTDLRVPPPTSGRISALVLDVPGLEAGILRSLDVDALNSFDWVALRSATAGLFEQADPPNDAATWLAQQHFRAMGEDTTDPLWIVTLASHDAQAAALAAAQRRLRSLEEQLATAQRDAQSAAQRAAQAQSEHASQVQRLTEARNKQAASAGELGQKLQAATEARVQAERLTQERLAQIDTVTKARDEQARLAADRLKRIGQLETELADTTARFGLLQEELIKAEAHVELISDLLLREPLR